jgi:hypothetical protein
MDDMDDDQPRCPDTCPRCGLDLEYEGWPVYHQHAETGDTCPFRWARIG